MRLSDALDFVGLTAVWFALGGGSIRNGRARAFWRNGDGLSVHVDAKKNVWIDHARGAHIEHGGGVLGLIQVVLGCDRKSAVRWFAQTFNLEIDGERPFTREERRRYAAARAEAERVVCWRDELLEQLRRHRNESMRLYHSAVQYIVQHGLLAPRAIEAADTADEHEAKYQELDLTIDALQLASWDKVCELYREELRAA